MARARKKKKQREPFWAEIAAADMQKRAEKAWKRRQKGTVTPQLAPMNLKRVVWPEHERSRNGEAKRGRKGT